MQYADDTTLSLVTENIGGELNEGLTQDVEEVAKWAEKIS